MRKTFNLPKNLTDADMQQRAGRILRLRRDGVTLRRIADRVGCSVEWVRKVLGLSGETEK